jgi:cation diffusion facilitator CzcD-associated flavoprotein CzcO
VKLSLDRQQKQNAHNSTYYDAVVVGAGPYGLSIAAHLDGMGLKVAIFGKLLALWRDHMPEGMLLRSFWWASNLSDPEKRYTLGRYLRKQGQLAHDPTSRETFIEYGCWFQRHAVPMLDETYVKHIERKGKLFTVRLVDGRVIHSPVVVMAPGVYYYIHRPREYQHLSSELVSHTCNHRTLNQFAGKRVVIVGGGQSALETAALLHEGGSEVEVVARSPLHWLSPENTSIPFIIRQLRAPKVGLGYGWMNWALEHIPYMFYSFPRSTKDRMLATFHGPAGAWWLKDRIVGKVPVHEQRLVEKVEETDGGVRLQLSDQKTLEADHVVLATGYRADIKRLPMLSPSLLASIQTYMDAPVLNSYFESSVPGLYFVGFTAARSAGPFYRFVVGTRASAVRIAASIERSFAQRK